MTARSYLLGCFALGLLLGWIDVPLLSVAVISAGCGAVAVVLHCRARAQREGQLRDGWKPVSGTVDSRRPRRQ